MQPALGTTAPADAVSASYGGAAGPSARALRRGARARAFRVVCRFEGLVRAAALGQKQRKRRQCVVQSGPKPCKKMMFRGFASLVG